MTGARSSLLLSSARTVGTSSFATVTSEYARTVKARCVWSTPPSIPRHHERIFPMSAKPTTTKPELVDPAVDPAAPSAAAPDPFDLASLRLNPSFLETAGVKKLVTTVPVKRPSPQDFFRVHPAQEYRDNFGMIDLKDDREEFLVHPSILPELRGEVVFKTIFTTTSRQGVVSLWPIRLPAPDERKTEWPRSAREAAELAQTRW